MADIAVIARGIGKQYAIGESHGSWPTLYDVLSSKLRGAQHPASASAAKSFWALRGVDFDIRQGEVVGIVGRNGAGKSTLLKILSRITAPTEGRVEIRGRLASLLEVGTGFHPELSGRENIFLNGAILGMRRQEVLAKFHQIVAFAEIENFVDTPVKRYSSGMYVRLAFAVAAHLDPEILIIDEVLAVGDARFQKRCLGKVEEIAETGRTVLFVSHNMLAVQRLCSRAIWLDAGSVKASGAVREVVDAYLGEGVREDRTRTWASPQAAPGNAEVRIARLAVENPAPEDDGKITTATGVRLVFEYWNQVPGAALNLSLHVYNGDDTLVFNAVSTADPAWLGKAFPQGRFRSVCIVSANILNADRYRVELLVVRDQAHVIYKDESALSFEVEEDVGPGAWHERMPGVVRPRLEWQTHWMGHPAHEGVPG